MQIFKKCPNCGFNNLDSNSHCTECDYDFNSTMIENAGQRVSADNNIEKEKNSKNENNNNILKIIIGLVIISFFFVKYNHYYLSCNSKNDSNEKTNKEVANDGNVSSKIKNLSDSAIENIYIKTGNKIEELSKIANTTNTQFAEITRNVANGNGSSYDAYDAAKTAQENFSNLGSEIFKISIPDGFPASLKDTLNLVLSDIATSYYTQSKAYSSAMEFYNSNNLEEMSNYKSKSNMAISFMQKSVKEMYSVRIAINKLKKKKK